MRKKNKKSKLFLSDIINEDTEFFPLMSDEDEENIANEDTPKILPILPLRNTVLFPGVIIPITLGRDRSVQLIKDAEKGDKTIGVLSQVDSTIEAPTQKDLNKIGTVANILKMLRMPDGNITAVIQGRKRFLLNEITVEEPYYKGSVSEINEIGIIIICFAIENNPIEELEK